MEKSHYLGHRERLRARFLENAEAMPDYEVLELVLASILPRLDVKPLAKTLLQEFGNVAEMLGASHDRLRGVNGLGPATAVYLKVVHELLKRALKDQLRDTPLLNSSQKVADYCRTAMAHLDLEQFRILFLDRKNYLLREEVQQNGTLDHTPLYPREVLKRALAVGAGGLIMVHNHPSGDPTPSQADIQMTKSLVTAAAAFDIRVLDHLVVGKFGYVSFREYGLLT